MREIQLPTLMGTVPNNSEYDVLIQFLKLQKLGTNNTLNSLGLNFPFFNVFIICQHQSQSKSQQKLCIVTSTASHSSSEI